MGVAFVKGLQGDDPKYLKVVATPKHYAVHSGPEPERHRFDASASERDLRETYLPAFRATITEARATSIMCAYNRTNGEPGCANKHLLVDILRGDWGFNGYVVSDCGAIDDIYRHHNFVKTAEEASALAVKRGTDIECGDSYRALVAAVKQGLVSEQEIDRAVKRLLRHASASACLILLTWSPTRKYRSRPMTRQSTGSLRSRPLANRLCCSRTRTTLPLRKDLKSIAVIGPNADDVAVMLGNYNGQPSRATTPLAGIRQKVAPQTKLLHALGATLTDVSLVPVPAVALRGPNGERGLKVEFFGNRNLEGGPILTRIDEEVNFDWGMFEPRAWCSRGQLLRSLDGQARGGSLGQVSLRRDRR